MDPYSAHINYRRQEFLAEAQAFRLAASGAPVAADTGHPTRARVRKALLAAIAVTLLAAGVATASGPSSSQAPGSGSGAGAARYHR